MPALSRHRQVPAPRQARSTRNSTDSNEGAGEHLWVVDEDYEKPQKEIDFPSGKSVTMPASETLRKKPHALRIDTYTKTDLQDRYLSSEEEPSPSPREDDHHQLDNEPKTRAEILVDDDALDGSITEYQAEIAIAVPIVAYGRPKLIDITNLAPMHKRKRSSDSKISVPHPSIRATASRAPSSAKGEHHALPVKNIIEVAVIPDKQLAQPALKRRTSHQLKRKESFSIPPPESWFPEEDSTDTADDASSKSDHPSPSDRPEHDHVSPKSTRLPRPRNFSGKHRTENVTRSSPVVPTAGIKSFTRTMSLIKRQSTQFQVNKQVVKKPKMIPRGASERQEMPIIPPFPFEGEVAAA